MEVNLAPLSENPSTNSPPTEERTPFHTKARKFIGRLCLILFGLIAITIIICKLTDFFLFTSALHDNWENHLSTLLSIADGFLIAIAFGFIGLHSYYWGISGEPIEEMDFIDSTVITMVIITISIAFLTYVLSITTMDKIEYESIRGILFIGISVSLFIISLGIFSFLSNKNKVGEKETGENG